MSATHKPTDQHLRQHRKKKRTKLKHLIAAGAKTGLAGIEAKLQKTYSAFHIKLAAK